MNFLVSLKSETIKLKRTSASYLCFIIALLVPIILFIESLDVKMPHGESLSWAAHYSEGREIFGFIFLPLYIILISTLLIQVEYRNNTWKQVFTSPQKIVNVFFSKFILFHLLIVLFILVYNVYLLLAGFAIELMKPNLFNGPIIAKQILIINGNMYLSVLGISAIQYWLALRFKNFIAPLAIGFCLWFLAPMFIFEMKFLYAQFYPYAFTFITTFPKFSGKTSLYLTLSFGYMLLFLILGLVEFGLKKSRT